MRCLAEMSSNGAKQYSIFKVILHQLAQRRRKRGRPKRTWVDAVSEDMQEAEKEEEDAWNQNRWRKRMGCGDPE